MRKVFIKIGRFLKSILMILANEIKLYLKLLIRIFQRPILAALCIFLLICISIQINQAYLENRLGFNDKNVWDWITILATPIIIGIGVAIIERSQRRVEMKVSSKARETERNIAIENRMQLLFQGYIDRMTELLIQYKIEQPSEKVKSIARARTFSVLRNLNKNRKKEVIRFLSEAKLIGVENQIVSLKGVDLSGIDLSGLDLRGSDLRKANLSGSNLSNAILNDADLSDSNLSKSKLKGAKLDSANLTKSNLENADLQGCQLEKSIMNSANLTNVNFKKAQLKGAEFRGAIINNPEFSDPTLWRGLDFSHAILSNINFDKSDLRGAEFVNTKFDNVSFNYCLFSGADFNNVDVTNVSFKGANMTNSTTIKETDFSKSIYDHTNTWPDEFDPESMTKTQRSRVSKKKKSSKAKSTQGKKIVQKYNPNISTILNKANLRPLPEIRAQLIEIVIERINSDLTKESLSELIDYLYEELNNKAQSQNIELKDSNKVNFSKGKIRNLFKALFMSNIFLNENGESVQAWDEKVNSLVSNEISTIEKTMCTVYIDTVLRSSPNLLDSKNNQQEFERTVRIDSFKPIMITERKKIINDSESIN